MKKTTSHTSRLPALAAIAFLFVLPGLVEGQEVDIEEESVEVGAGLRLVDTPGIGTRWMIEAHGLPVPPPFFFSGEAETEVQIDKAGVELRSALSLRVIQGQPEVFALRLSGDGEVSAVEGDPLEGWSVRRDAEGQRWLELFPVVDEEESIEAWSGTVTMRVRPEDGDIPYTVSLPMLGAGKAVGWSHHIRASADATVEVEPMPLADLLPLQAGEPEEAAAPQPPEPADDAEEGEAEEGEAEEEPGPEGMRMLFAYQSSGVPQLDVTVRRSGEQMVVLRNMQLDGERDGDVMRFTLSATAHIREQDPAPLPLLTGEAMPMPLPDGSPVKWVMHVDEATNVSSFALQFTGQGEEEIEVSFVSPVRELDSGWERVQFRVLAGAAVPLALQEWDERPLEFREDALVIERVDGVYTGFLPVAGQVHLAWNATHETEVERVFFTSEAVEEVVVAAGAVRQRSEIHYRPMQGEMQELELAVEGEGEILRVAGPAIRSWDIVEGDEGRVLRVNLASATDAPFVLGIDAQVPMESLPGVATPLRIVPLGGVRHGGMVRARADGAVLIEPVDLDNMTQVSPDQFPGEALGEGIPSFVLRYPSADARFSLQAGPILPEVSVSQVVVHTLAASERNMVAAIELDIREAPIRDFGLRIPEGYTVVEVAGHQVTDYRLDEVGEDGLRGLEVLFGQGIIGRHVVQLTLELNVEAEAGGWTLPVLLYPDAVSVRGHIGAATQPGFRLSLEEAEGVSDQVLSYFPRQVPGLQQAFRQRDEEFSIVLEIEVLGQSVHADLFHLHTLNPGMVYSSVLINYFIVGAPVERLRVQLPEGIGNVSIDGPDVRSWSIEDGEAQVLLSQPALGAYTMLVTWENPTAADGGEIGLTAARALGVQAESGYVKVVSPTQVEVEESELPVNLVRIEASEVPAEFRLLSSAPVVRAYQYGARPAEADLAIRWFVPGTTSDQVIDFAGIESRVLADGQVMTKVRYYVKSRDRQPLRLRLPENDRLWSVRVDGRDVIAQEDEAGLLIPMPSEADPNTPVEVAIEYGGTVENVRRPIIRAPLASSPVLMTEWNLQGEGDHVLVATGGSAMSILDSVRVDGLAWFEGVHLVALWILVGLTLVIAAILYGVRGRLWWRRIFLVGLIGCIGLAAVLAFAAALERPDLTSHVQAAASAVPADTDIWVELRHLPEWRAGWSPLAAVLIVIGLVAFGVAGLLRGSSASLGLRGAGWLLLALGLLSMPAGVTLLAVWFAAFVLVEIFLRHVFVRGDAGAVTPPAMVWIGMLFSLGLLAGAGDVRGAEGGNGAGAIVEETWEVSDTGLEARLQWQAEMRTGERLVFLRSPAVLSAFEGDGVAVERNDEHGHYEALALRDGMVSVSARYRVHWPEGTQQAPITALRGAVHTIDLTLPEGTTLVPARGVAILDHDNGLQRVMLGLGHPPELRWWTERRSREDEVARFVVETADAFLFAPGSMDGFHQLHVRIPQGRIDRMVCIVPDGLTVGEVRGDALQSWRFDADEARLTLFLKPGNREEFELTVLTQGSAGALPAEHSVRPLEVLDAAGQVGRLGLLSSQEVQIGEVEATALTGINADDFDIEHVEDGGREGAFSVRRAYRYTDVENAALELTLFAVQPELRVEQALNLSIGEERLLLSAAVHVDILRAGIFRLDIIIPDGFDLESASGEALSHWTESTEDDVRRLTLHLHKRTSGRQLFNLTFLRPGLGDERQWEVPRLDVEGAARTRGQFVLVPETGLRLSVVEREGITQMDARELDVRQSGALAFRLLQGDWRLLLGIESMDPWVTASILQEVAFREGRTQTRVGARLRVENAAVRTLRVRLPVDDAAAEETVRITGPAVADALRLPGEEPVWEIRFQRRLLGETPIEIFYENLEEEEEALQRPVRMIQFEEVRRADQFVALRSTGRLQMEVDEVTGLTRADWNAVPAALKDGRQTEVPGRIFKVADASATLPVALVRHTVADALRLQVKSAKLHTLLSPVGAAMHTLQLEIAVVEQSALKFALPEGSRLLSAFVNGTSAQVVVLPNGEGRYQLLVKPAAIDVGTSTVEIAYTSDQRSAVNPQLIAPMLSIPMESVQWDVSLPPGYILVDAEGNLDFRSKGIFRLFSLEDYLELDAQRRETISKEAMKMLDQAGQYRKEGRNFEAREALFNAYQSGMLDDASDEDARVQLREVQTEQALIGMNSRRQRIVRDNVVSGEAAPAQVEQMLQAADFNPILQGKLEYDPAEMQQQLQGNTAEENIVLRRLANQIVSQQQAAEPAPQGIRITLADLGETATFERGLLVEDGPPLELNLQLRTSEQLPMREFFAIALALVVLIAGGLILSSMSNNRRVGNASA